MLHDTFIRGNKNFLCIHQLLLDITRINLSQERFGFIYLIRFIDLRSMDYEEQDTFILNWDALFFLSLFLFWRSVSVVISYITNATRTEREY